MATSITPTATFAPYPVTNIPENGVDVVDAVVMKNILQDIHDRAYYLKGISDGHTTDIANLQSADTNLQNQITTNASNITSNSDKLTNLNTNMGGNAQTSSPDAWSGSSNIPSGTSWKAAIELNGTTTTSNSNSINTLSPKVTTNENDINSIANKLANDAKNGVAGLGLGAEYYLDNSDTAKNALSKVSQALYANRRTLNDAYLLSTMAWKTAEGGVGYTYDTLENSDKINAANSSTSAYNEQLQEFGLDTGSWLYYCNIVTVPSGTNTVKLQMNGTGDIAASVNLAGSYTTGFTSIAALDTWTSVTAGTQLVIKIVASSNYRLYNYSLLWKTV